MHTRLSLVIALSLGALAYACSSKGDGNDTTAPSTSGPSGGEQGNGDPGTPGSSNGGTPGQQAKNPIEGIAPAKVVLQTDAYTDGPVWHTGLQALYFTTPLGDGALYRMKADGSAMQIREGSAAQGTTPIGNTVLASGDLVTVDARRIVRTTVAGDAGQAPPNVIASGFAGDGGTTSFDTLNDVVARKDGTLYVTDPGYFTDPIANRIYRITPAGVVSVVDAFDDVPRPNGIALSPDEKSLYVGFTQPLQGKMPFIRKYTVNADGSLGESAKFVEIGPVDSSPDGLAVDSAGNVYVATKGGIQVFAPDASKIGVVAVPEAPTGVAFGNTDMKSLYVTTVGTRIWELRLNIAGRTK